VSLDTLKWACQHRAGGGTAKAVLLVLAFHADRHTGECWPGHRLIEHESEFSRSAVTNAIRQLRDRGLLDVTPKRDRRGRRIGTLYRLRIDKGSQRSSAGSERAQGGPRASQSQGPERAPNRQPEPSGNVLPLRGKTQDSPGGPEQRGAPSYNDAVERA
jgi:DNA-binding transcriptional ArsR family regulator